MKTWLISLVAFLCTMFALPYFIDGMNMRWWIGIGAIGWAVIFFIEIATSSNFAWVDGCALLFYIAAILFEQITRIQQCAYVLNLILAVDVFVRLAWKIINLQDRKRETSGRTFHVA